MIKSVALCASLVACVSTAAYARHFASPNIVGTVCHDDHHGLADAHYTLRMENHYGEKCWYSPGHIHEAEKAPAPAKHAPAPHPAPKVAPAAAPAPQTTAAAPQEALPANAYAYAPTVVRTVEAPPLPAAITATILPRVAPKDIAMAPANPIALRNSAILNLLFPWSRRNHVGDYMLDTKERVASR